MNVFEAVRGNVTARQAAELYGIRVNRHGMAVCPFHNDKNPSMKVDKRFHCFACQADGDAVDFVSRLFGLPGKKAAVKIANDFGIGYDSGQKPSVRPKIREPTPEQKYQQEENRCFKVLSDYFHHLRTWKRQYAPQQPEDEWHPLFVEALQRESHIEYLLDVLLYGTAEEKKALVAEQRKEVIRLEQRFAEHPDGYEELSKARDEAKQLQIYKANAEMLLRTDTEEQRQTREHQQEKQHCFAGHSRTGTVRSIRGLGSFSPTSSREISGDGNLPVRQVCINAGIACQV